MTDPLPKAIDVVICDRSIARARLIVAGIKRANASAVTVRVPDVTQAQRLMFEQGLFTREPQIPRVLLIERAIPGRESLQYGLQRHWRTLSLPIIEIVSAAERFRLTGTAACVIDSADAERFQTSIARAVTPHFHHRQSLSPQHIGAISLDALATSVVR